MTPKIRQIQLVGQKIRQLRKQRRLTQTELASHIGIQQSDLSRMEKGEYRVSLDTLFRILSEFNMGIGEFFDEMAREDFSPRDINLVRDFNKLPDDVQREVQDFIAFKRAQAPAASEGPAAPRRNEVPLREAAAMTGALRTGATMTGATMTGAAGRHD